MMAWLNKDRRITGLVLAMLLALGLIFGSSHDEPEGLLLYIVKEEAFSSKVVESGVLRSMNSITISSSLPSNRAKIITLVAEGKYVQQGELLVEFDHAPLLKDKAKHEANIRELESQMKQVSEEFRLQRLESEKLVSSIKHDISMTELQSKNTREGELSVKTRELMAGLADAKNEWQRDLVEYQDLKTLLADGFVTKNEVEQARIKMLHAENTYQLQQKKIQVLKEISIPAEYKKSATEISKKKTDLGRQKKMAEMSSIRSQTTVERTYAKLAAARQALKTTEKHLLNARITAPASGFVIFKTVPILAERRKVHVGDSVWANQGFMVLPDISRMAVEIRVREVDIYKIKLGQPALIGLDSYPDLALLGKVALIGAIAESEAEYRGGKFFRVNVLIHNADQRMRPGMTARTEIIASEFDHVLQIPLNAVFKKQDKDYCYIWDGDVELRPIQTGPSNDNFIVVHAGLKAGEQVVLAAPEGMIPQP